MESSSGCIRRIDKEVPKDPELHLIVDQWAIRRGSFSSIKVVIATIEQLVVAHDKTKAPVKWTRKADSVLVKIKRICSQISGTGH